MLLNVFNKKNNIKNDSEMSVDDASFNSEEMKEIVGDEKMGAVNYLEIHENSILLRKAKEFLKEHQNWICIDLDGEPIIQNKRWRSEGRELTKFMMEEPEEGSEEYNKKLA